MGMSIRATFGYGIVWEGEESDFSLPFLDDDGYENIAEWWYDINHPGHMEKEFGDFYQKVYAYKNINPVPMEITPWGFDDEYSDSRGFFLYSFRNDYAHIGCSFTQLGPDHLFVQPDPKFDNFIAKYIPGAPKACWTLTNYYSY